MSDIRINYKKRAEKLIETVKLLSEKVKEMSGKKELTEDEEIILNLRKAFNDWKKKELYFECVTEPDLVDHAIYEIEASKIKYIYFLKKARKRNIVLK